VPVTLYSSPVSCSPHRLSPEYVSLGPRIPFRSDSAYCIHGTGDSSRTTTFYRDESRGNLLLSLQLPKFNLLEDAHRQLALRIRTVYARTADRIAEELAAAKAAGTGALRLERLERAHTTAQRLASESVEETAAWVKEQFTAAEQGRADSLGEKLLHCPFKRVLLEDLGVPLRSFSWGFVLSTVVKPEC